MIFKRLLLLSYLFKFTVTYYHYAEIDRTTDTTYDCIYSYLDVNFFQNVFRKISATYQKPAEQLVPYCLVGQQTFNDGTICTENDGVIWTFEQLKQLYVTSHDLIQWGAQINVVDAYELFFQSVNDKPVASYFCNCSDVFDFGVDCQYKFEHKHKSFDTILHSHFSNQDTVQLDGAFIMDDASSTCYRRDGLCFGACLDWRQICNGIVDCEGGQDEISCESLEFNQCRDDEYRCRSGYCIPLMCAFDKFPDCDDGSDETNVFLNEFKLRYCYKKVPNIFCDEFNSARMKFPCGDGDVTSNIFHGCDNGRTFRILYHLYTDNSTPCSRYMLCTQISADNFPKIVDLDALCDEFSNLTISSVCPESTIVFPVRSIMFSPSVYLVYQTNESQAKLPTFICYTHCVDQYPPSSTKFGYSCRSIKDLLNEPFLIGETLPDIFADVIFLFTGCIDRILRSNASLIYRCPLSSQALSQHRINDGFKDCHWSSGELNPRDSCIPNSNQQFRCWNDANECIHLRLKQDASKDCSDHSDEFYWTLCVYGTELECDYQRGLYTPALIHYEFEELCNGKIKEPSLFSFLNDTDETDCEDFWCSLSPSRLCNGYWDCKDGRDELNCSLDMLPFDARSAKLLHTLNNCTINEHFCVHVANRSEDISRSCIHVSFAGDGYIDCWGAIDERKSVCRDNGYPVTLNYVYHCAGQAKKCTAVNRICDANIDCPMQDDEMVCSKPMKNTSSKCFRYKKGFHLFQPRSRCNNVLDCPEGEDEWFCDLPIKGPTYTSLNNHVYWFYPQSLEYMQNSEKHSVSARVVTSSSVKSNWFCNRGMPVKVNQSFRCLCPPSYSGNRCENQRSRIILLLDVISPHTIPRAIAVKVFIYLVELSSLNILAQDEIVHLPYIHSSYKHLVSLPSEQANNAFVHIDAYYVNIERFISYRSSWKFSIPFPFLPVRRLSLQLMLPIDDNEDDHSEILASRIRSLCRQCLQGRCLTYENSADVFCQCNDGWTGLACDKVLHCAIGSKSLNSYRCLCPLNRHGNRCFVPNIPKCHCENGGTCLPLDPRTGQSACLCAENYFGRHCNQQNANLTVLMSIGDQPETLPIVLLQFIDMSIANNELYFENTFLFQHLSSTRTLVIHHNGYEKLPQMVLAKIFYSASVHDYAYYILLHIPRIWYMSRIPLKQLETQLSPRLKCVHVSEIPALRAPINIVNYPHIKRSKRYMRACDDNITNCFHDEFYLCFCPPQPKLTVSCINYPHNRAYCQKPDYCFNGALCVENRQKNKIQIACLCSSCHYYGRLCQFSTLEQGLSLDALIGTAMHTGEPLSKQSILIKTCIALLTGTIFIGSVGNALSIAVFARNEPRRVGCGYYLLIVSIFNQLTLILLGARFIYFLITQLFAWKDTAKSLIVCQCLDFGISYIPNVSTWLSACVSVDRTIAAIKGALFNQKASVRTAKYVCLVLLIMFVFMDIHIPLSRRLITDPQLRRFTWCVPQQNSQKIRKAMSILLSVELLGPFIINFFSTGILIRIISRQKLSLHKTKGNSIYAHMLMTQIAHFKHLLIGPIVLLVLTVPRLITFFGSLCMSTSWHNYLFLAGYFISFIPFVATLLIFVLPSPTYRHELQKVLSCFYCYCSRLTH